VEIVNDLRKQVDHVIEDTTDNYYRDPIPSAANADNVRDYVLKLRKFREDVKRERNDFARSCNKLGTQYENKSVLEQDVVRLSPPHTPPVCRACAAVCAVMCVSHTTHTTHERGADEVEGDAAARRAGGGGDDHAR
jgi:hypothetical protein